MDANLKLDGKKVFLTPMMLEDAEIFVKWRNSEFVMSRFLIRKPFTLESQIEWIKNKVLTGQVVQFIIWDKNDNRKIGCTYLLNIDNEKKECEFGILIGEKEYLGGGRGTEANELICKYGFEQLGMEKIYLRVLADNKMARQSYLNAGYEEEGDKEKIVLDGRAVDVIFMSKRKNGSES